MKRAPGIARLLVVMLVLSCMAVSALAQATATLVGTVRDASGAVVPKATLEATNRNTGFRRAIQANGQGEYTLTALPTGVYTVTATVPGFKVATVEGISLAVDQAARVDITLTVGALQEVTVGAAPTAIQTDTSSISQVIDNRQVLDLPLVSRNFADLVALTPGALTSDSFGGPTSGEVTGFTTVAVAGGQNSKTEFLFDGISDSEELFDGVQFTPSIDFIQEFRVLTNSFPAQYGRGSAVVTISSRAGTNKFHGVAYEFLRNDAADAENYNFSSSPLAKPPLRRNLFGGSLGGPIFRDKLFFYLNYEGLRQTNPTNFNNVPVPSLLERSGDFSQSGVAQLYNPVTLEPYTGNKIPVDPAAAFLLQYVPLANASVANPSDVTAGTFSRTAANTTNYDQGNVRVDYSLTSKDLLFGRFSIQDGAALSPGYAPTNGATTNIDRFRNAVGGWTHIFSPRLLNELHVGYNHLYSDRTIQGLGTNITNEAGILGFNGGPNGILSAFPGFPTVGAGPYTITVGGNFSPIINPTTTWNAIDTVTYTAGKHTILAGIDLRRFHFTSTNGAWSRGNFSYNGTATAYAGEPGASSALADFIAGFPEGFNARSYPRDLFGERTFDFPLFVQDDWKFSDRVTFNLGLRYDLDLAPTQDFGANSNFDVTTGRWVVGTVHGKINPNAQQIEPASLAAFSQYIETAGEAGLSQNIQTVSKKNFAPRAGFAARPFGNDRFVVRGAYGIFYLLPRGNNTVTNALVNVPFIYDEFESNTQLPSTVATAPGAAPGGYTPPATTETLFNHPTTSSESLISAQDVHIRPPYNQEWNLAVQQDLGRSVSLQIAYVGNRGTRLERDLPLNYATPQVAGTVTSVESRRPTGVPGTANYNPNAAGGDNFTNSGNSFYHSLQTTLERRSARGANFLAAYTWSKLIDDAVEGSNDQDASSTQDPTNLRLDRGRGQLDVAHRLVVSYSYPLPFGRGQMFGSNAPRAVDLAIGGWKLSGIAQFQSGSPFSVTSNADPLNIGGEYNHRADEISTHTTGPRTINEWFNTGAFADQKAIGTSGRNILSGPRYQNFDVSLLKEFHRNEQQYLELRIEAFNVLNHPNFGLPDSNVDDGARYGTITSAADPRRMQAAAKIYF